MLREQEPDRSGSNREEEKANRKLETTGEEKEHTSITMFRAALGIEEKKTAGVNSSILHE